jgi:hypothetical protein
VTDHANGEALEYFFIVFANKDMELIHCTETDVWRKWNREFPEAVRLTDVNGWLMMERDRD